MNARCNPVPAGTTESLVAQILEEGEQTLLAACRSAGMRGRLPNVYYLMREARAGRLEAIKRCGQWRTSGPRVRAWLARTQPPRATSRPTVAKPDVNRVLRRYGLAREEGK